METSFAKNLFERPRLLEISEKSWKKAGRSASHKKKVSKSLLHLGLTETTTIRQTRVRWILFWARLREGRDRLFYEYTKSMNTRNQRDNWEGREELTQSARQEKPDICQVIWRAMSESKILARLFFSTPFSFFLPIIWRADCVSSSLPSIGIQGIIGIKSDHECW